MLRRLALLLALLSLTSCSSGWFTLSNIFGFGGQGPALRIVNAVEVSRVILIYAEKVRYERHLNLEDSVVYYDTHINRIRLDFSSMDNIGLCEARALLVDVVEEFLGGINENPAIVSDLANASMTPADLEVYITFPSFYNRYINLRTIGLVTLRKGIASYFAADALSCDTQCWHRRSEYYFQSRNFTEFKRQGEDMYRPPLEDLMERSAFEEERYFSNPGNWNTRNGPPVMSNNPNSPFNHPPIEGRKPNDETYFRVK